MFSFKEWFINETRKSAVVNPEVEKWLISAEKLKLAIEKLKLILKKKEDQEAKKPKVKPEIKTKEDKKPDKLELKKPELLKKPDLSKKTAKEPDKKIPLKKPVGQDKNI